MRRRAVLLAGVIWLCGGAVFPARAGRVARLTHYYSTGNQTASGLWPVAGLTAACSYDLPLWAWVRVGSDWYQCQDRGQLGDGSSGYSWLDLYEVPAEAWYGAWATVEVWQ